MAEFRGTTICAVRRNGEIAIAGDGQVTMGENVIMKNGAKKVRRIFDGKVVIGFAGSVADAFALSEKFEGKLTQYAGNLPRAAVELAQDWRMNKEMRKLEALLLVADKENLMLVSGTGEGIGAVAFVALANLPQIGGLEGIFGLAGPALLLFWGLFALIALAGALKPHLGALLAYFALAAARALYDNTGLSARDIAYKALKIASSICVYTNDHIIVEVV